MEWSNESSLHLIHQYQLYPVLWDSKYKYYYSKKKKRQAWIRIAKYLRKDVEDVKKKIPSLLGSFRREKAKGKRTIGTGTARKDVYVSKWFAFEAFKFLLDRDDPRPIHKTVSVNDSFDHSFDHSFDDSNEFQDDLIDNMVDSITSPKNISEIVNDENENESDDVLLISSHPPKKKKKTNLVDQHLEESYEMSERPYPTTSAHDWSIYGQHVANKLREYPKQTSYIVQHNINNLLFEADMGKYDANPYQFIQPFQHFSHEISTSSSMDVSHNSQHSFVLCTPHTPAPPISTKSEIQYDSDNSL